AEGLLAGSLDGLMGGTFHWFANIVLRRYAKLFGWPESFTILDRSDSEDTVQLARVRLGLDRKERRFPRKQTLAEIFSAAVNKVMPVIDVIEREYAQLVTETEDILRCFAAYVEYKRDRNLLDYDDLLTHLRDRLRDEPEFALRLGGRYRYVMVDEYQDT